MNENKARLFLLGDAEVLDAVAELCGRAGYDELHRADDLAPSAAPLGPDDYVVVASSDGKRGRELLARVLLAGDAGYVGLCVSEKEALVALLKLSADRVPKAKLDRVATPAGTSFALGADELAILVSADLVRARKR